MGKSSRHTNFIKQNWFNIATLLVSVAALVYAYESNRTAEEANRIMLAANQISINSSSSRIDLICYDSQQDLKAWVCPPVTGQSSSFVEASNVFTFVNRGGKAASLIEAAINACKETITSLSKEKLLMKSPAKRDTIKIIMAIVILTLVIWLIMEVWHRKPKQLKNKKKRK